MLVALYRRFQGNDLLLENNTYADGGLSGAFSSAFGCLRYFLLVTMTAPGSRSSSFGGSGRGATSGGLVSSMLGCAKGANEASGASPR